MPPPTQYDPPAGHHLTSLLFRFQGRGPTEKGLQMDIVLDNKVVGRIELYEDRVELPLLFAASPRLLALAQRCYAYLTDGGTEAQAIDLRYDLHWAVWGTANEPRVCHRHPDADVIPCGNEECPGRFLCLGAEPHHLDDDDARPPGKSDPYQIEVQLRTQVDSWFEVHEELPPGRHFTCPRCGHWTHARWRRTGRSIKITCFGCHIQVDVVAPPTARR